MTHFTDNEPPFQEWPKIARLNRRVIVTEKIDGTNAAVVVTPEGDVWAQSRKKIITPQSDNMGFANWVNDNADTLAEILGEGYHFGEWYGSKIQSNPYKLDNEKRFMLFNTERWGKPETRELLRGRAGVEVATVLYDGPFNTEVINSLVFNELRVNGSAHVPGSSYVEGVVVFHPAGNLSFKVTVEQDEAPKGARNQ